MKKKILIFAPYALSTSHQELSLETACKHNAAGWETHIVHCHRSFETCDQNPKHKWLLCQNCKSTAKTGAKLLGIPNSQIHSYLLRNAPAENRIPEFNTFEELKTYTYESLPVGSSVAASLISGQTRDVNPDVIKHRPFIIRAIRTYVGIHHCSLELIKKVQPQKVYLFNGRSFAYHASLLAAKKAEVFTEVGERASFESYVLFENTHCLDIRYTIQEIENFALKMKEDPKAKEIAEMFFNNCLSGKNEMHNDYPGLHKKGLLPDEFSSDHYNIALFTSSDDELAVDPGWKNPLFLTQAEAIKKLAEALPRETRVRLYVRIHPNLKGLNSTQEKNLLSLKVLPYVTVLPSDSPISSYTLLNVCNKVISFGSTIGIEAVYWEKPVVLAGRAWYETIGACYIPKTQEEFVDLALADLPPKPREKALPFGYWSLKRNHPFQYISPQDPKTGNASLYDGRNIMEVNRWLGKLNHGLLKLRLLVRPLLGWMRAKPQY